MENLKIVGWTDFDSDYPTKTLTNEEISDVVNMIAIEIAANGYVFGGEDHQNSLTGVPVFSDGTCFRASMRAWGLLMASVQQKVNGLDVSYMDYYMSLGSEKVMPGYSEIDVEPADVPDSLGFFIQPDYEMVQQSVAMGMMFMTTDKVLESLYEILNNNKKD